MIAVSPEARKAGDALTEVLIALADRGALTPCQSDPAPFYADHPDLRAEALEACRHCPVIAACGTFANLGSERHGVWGGLDRSASPARATHLPDLEPTAAPAA